MATIPQTKPKQRTLDESAAELYRLLEEHFDQMGLTEAERDERYARAERRVTSAGAAHAKSET
jgi:hypothetical protein